jgi:hypothetical protein
MWTSGADDLTECGGQRIEVLSGSDHLSFADALTLLQSDEHFRQFFIDLLVNAPSSAFRWETPPVSKATLDRKFEFVLLDCPSLERAPDSAAFAAQFAADRAGTQVVTFANLGRDAVLVVPTPGGRLGAYTHLASFLRQAPSAQIHSLWIAVSKAMHARVNDDPVWLSTAGMGVPWLHVRLDDRPKYYGYKPYKQF